MHMLKLSYMKNRRQRHTYHIPKPESKKYSLLTNLRKNGTLLCVSLFVIVL